ncbi:MAG: AraC family transcriptional regulator [Pseudomonadota bacterium]
MYPVAKALWFIESHLGSELSLEQVAQGCGLSRFSLTRVFGMTTGYSVMRYVRARRLSEAARALAAGAVDILGVALEAGYGSHEAFTRAFREQFGLAPEELRAQGTLDDVLLVEPFRMNQLQSLTLQVSRFEKAGPLLVAGFGERFSFATTPRIPGLWQRFAPAIASMANPVGGCTFGVCHNRDDEGGFDYLAGVEVSTFAGLAERFQRVKIPTGRYAVFNHSGHIAQLRDTFYILWNHWLPQSGYQVGDTPEFVRCSADFDPLAGTGTVEIWLPIEA